MKLALHNPTGLVCPCVAGRIEATFKGRPSLRGRVIVRLAFDAVALLSQATALRTMPLLLALALLRFASQALVLVTMWTDANSKARRMSTPETEAEWRAEWYAENNRM